MSMLNQAAVEALCSATYLENYLDCLENLPDDLQRSVSQMRELDSQTCDLLKDIEHHREIYQKEPDSNQKRRSLIQIQRALIRSQELGDEKLQLVSQIIEHIENRTRQLQQDLENLDPGTIEREHDEPKPPVPIKPAKTEEKVEKTVKRQRRQRTHQETVSKEEEKKEEKEKPKKKKKRKAKKDKEGEKSPIDFPVDPDEPTYCLCDQVSYGEMIGCDNEECPIEWFHFNCVGLTTKPKGKWFCPKCRGDKSNVRRQDK